MGSKARERGKKNTKSAASNFFNFITSLFYPPTGGRLLPLLHRVSPLVNESLKSVVL
jgi:hypothetical protein